VVLQSNYRGLFLVECLRNLFLDFLQWFMWGSRGLSSVLDILLFVFRLFLWVHDLWVESSLAGHRIVVRDNLKFSFVLVLVTEITFFGGLFWLFFRNCFSPGCEMGFSWGVVSRLIHPFAFPILNSVILLTSSATLTVFQYFMLVGFYSFWYLDVTLILGGYFLYIQYLEYCYRILRLSDGVLCSVFYVLTFCHACHVLTG